MKSSSTLSVGLVLLATLFSAGRMAAYHKHSDLLTIDIDSDLAYYCMQGIKGFVIGYQEGFYKSSKDVSAECMNE